VITTADWKPYVPPSQYEYLVYSVLTQSIVLHLNTQCSGLPVAAFRESREGVGKPHNPKHWKAGKRIYVHAATQRSDLLI